MSQATLSDAQIVAGMAERGLNVVVTHDQGYRNIGCPTRQLWVDLNESWDVSAATLNAAAVALRKSGW